ncbi:hypothetical protein AB0M28_14215 [Streptomyces sp. NPDC051940]|uniref:hypothetical protein n=1 Tax=Streptomyces sp. NPDC051940 TaxID=3155675 RepID=UPI0034299BE0
MYGVIGLIAFACWLLLAAGGVMVDAPLPGKVVLGVVGAGVLAAWLQQWMREHKDSR